MIEPRPSCRQTLYEEAIFCSLCRQFYDKTGRDRYWRIIICNGHSFHVGCFHTEYRDLGGGENMFETCIECHEALPNEEASKLRWYEADPKYCLYATLMEGHPSPLKVISPRFYTRLVREALSRKLLPMAECLKRIQHRYLSLDEQKELIIELFKNPSMVKMCWVFNKFDLSFVCRLWGRQLSWFILERFIAAEAYNELYTVAMNDFGSVDEKLLSEIGAVLYRVLKREPGKLTYCLPSTIQEPFRLFEEFCEACPERSGFICQQMFPSAMESYSDKNDYFYDDTGYYSSDSGSYCRSNYHFESCFEFSDPNFESSYHSSTPESEESSDRDRDRDADATRIHWMRSCMPDDNTQYDLSVGRRIISYVQLGEEENKVFSGFEAAIALDWEVIETLNPSPIESKLTEV